MKKPKSLSKAVIDIDGVEYLIDEFAEEMIEKGSKEVVLLRLFDQAVLVLSAEKIRKIIEKGGIVDHLD